MPRKKVKQSIRVVRFATAAWQVGDIKSLEPAWSDERCADFLRAHGKHIQEAMVQAGWNAIAALMTWEATR